MKINVEETFHYSYDLYKFVEAGDQKPLAERVARIAAAVLLAIPAILLDLLFLPTKLFTTPRIQPILVEPSVPPMPREIPLAEVHLLQPLASIFNQSEEDLMPVDNSYIFPVAEIVETAYLENCN